MARPRVFVERTLVDYPAPTPQPTLCRLWQGPVDRDGYGILGITHNGKRSRKRVHRWVWEQRRGPIPEGMVVRHKCDNRCCFRLSHLELGTIAENNQDASDRGHLGPIRKMSPTEVVAVWERHEAGETYRAIWADYPQYSLPTIKRVKDYIDECRELLIDTPVANPATGSTTAAADATSAPELTASPLVEPKGSPSSTPGATKSGC